MKGLCGGKLLRVVTFVFLWAIWRCGDGDRVKHATVLPSVVWITDTLHLVTASLQDGEEKLEWTRSTIYLAHSPPNLCFHQQPSTVVQDKFHKSN